MKNLKFQFVFLFFSFLFLDNAEAQSYKLAGGVRLGYPVSLSLKYFINEAGALEGYIGTRRYGYLASSNYRGNTIGGAYQHHFSLGIDDLEDLQWYIGAGASIYLWSYGRNIPDNDRVNSSLALQGYLGLDYAFDDAPINISLDWSPTILLRGLGNRFGGDYGSLAIRYIFNR